MDTFTAAAALFDPEAITPLHLVVAVLANVLWVGLVLRDRRRAARSEESENPE